MLGMSATELVIILALALLLLGPDQLPSVAKMLGKGMREIRKATDDLKSTFEQEMVKLDDEPKAPRMIAPLGGNPGAPLDGFPGAPSGGQEGAQLGGDPAAARAAARNAAAPADPGAARAAARMAAMAVAPPTAAVSGPPPMVPPEGVVPRGLSRPDPVNSPSAPVAVPVSEEPKA